ncbi:MAG TPA: hypothetical protein VFV66_04665 [Nonomuraea sp.]|nr:hypothetical protein [Nonomuraea sp.]
MLRIQKTLAVASVVGGLAAALTIAAPANASTTTAGSEAVALSAAASEGPSAQSVMHGPYVSQQQCEDWRRAFPGQTTPCYYIVWYGWVYWS